MIILADSEDCENKQAEFGIRCPYMPKLARFLYDVVQVTVVGTGELSMIVECGSWEVNITTSNITRRDVSWSSRRIVIHEKRNSLEEP